jgi:hypothetical protein
VCALLQVDRLQDVEVERVLDLAPSIARREREIDDDGVLRVKRVDLAVGLAGELLVLANAGPGVAAKGRRLGRRDLNLGDARLGARHAQQGARDCKRERKRSEARDAGAPNCG